jgi:plastocyanin
VNRRAGGSVSIGMATRSALTRPARRWRAIGISLVLLMGLAACGDDDGDVDAADATSSSASGGARTDDAYGDRSGGDDVTGSGVVAKDFAFTDATVAAGAEVTFENQDDAPHTLTADEGAFDTGDVAGGSSGSITAPSEPGEYAFHCEIHSSMTGTLTVEG